MEDKNMKKYFISLILINFLTINLLYTQNIELYGFGCESIDSVTCISAFYKIEPFSATSNIISYFEEIDGIAQGSSTFDYNFSNYIFYGIDTSYIHRFYVIDTLGNIVSNPQVSEVNACGLQYNMQNQNLYGIITDTSTNTKSLGIINSNNASINLINVLSNEIIGIQKGVTFNSNTEKYIFIGYDIFADKKLYFVNAQNGIIENDFSINHCYLGELQFDNIKNKLFAIYKDTGLTNTLKYFVEIDTLTGATFILDTINELNGIVGGSSVYDQYTGTLIFEGEDTSHVKRLYLINSSTGEIISNSLLNSHVVDFQCDNTKFAKDFYTSVVEKKATVNNLTIYPNPNNGTFQLTFSTEKPQNITVQLINELGQVLLSENYPGFNGNYSQNIDVSKYSAGIYKIVVNSGDRTYTEKVMVK
ncbi:MAG: T9SS type A sorting domain-containing protein [Bacteroidia bacterium]|nr:T9SS type A sorting domain-containing protein [Bacteroidia bacterium]